MLADLVVLLLRLVGGEEDADAVGLLLEGDDPRLDLDLAAAELLERELLVAGRLVLLGRQLHEVLLRRLLVRRDPGELVAGVGGRPRGRLGPVGQAVPLPASRVERVDDLALVVDDRGRVGQGAPGGGDVAGAADEHREHLVARSRRSRSC